MARGRNAERDEKGEGMEGGMGGDTIGILMKEKGGKG